MMDMEPISFSLLELIQNSVANLKKTKAIHWFGYIDEWQH